MKVFFDSCILIDVFTNRDKSCGDSIKCFELVAKGKIKGYLSSRQLTDIYYCIRKYISEEATRRQIIKILCNVFEVMPFCKQNIINAMADIYSDMEDGTQDDVAKCYCCNYLLTNDMKGYKNSKSIICSPKEFLELFSVMENQDL